MVLENFESFYVMAEGATMTTHLIAGRGPIVGHVVITPLVAGVVNRVTWATQFPAFRLGYLSTSKILYRHIQHNNIPTEVAGRMTT